MGSALNSIAEAQIADIETEGRCWNGSRSKEGKAVFAFKRENSSNQLFAVKTSLGFKMNHTSISAHEQAPLALSHEEFRTGLPVGRFHLIVHPFLAQQYVHQKLFVMYLALPLLLLGLAFGLYGAAWVGLPLMILVFLMNPLARVNAPRILVFLAARSVEIYRHAIEQHILEVRLARCR